MSRRQLVRTTRHEARVPRGLDGFAVVKGKSFCSYTNNVKQEILFHLTRVPLSTHKKMSIQQDNHINSGSNFGNIRADFAGNNNHFRPSPSLFECALRTSRCVHGGVRSCLSRYVVCLHIWGIWRPISFRSVPLI